jgi:sugar O-acyltransferase (sialic acid O-acetyltransferase NeuD family)
MGDIVVFGTGGFAREVHQLIDDLSSDGVSWNVLGFLDDDPDRGQDQVHDLPVLGTRAWLKERKVAVALGVGATPARRRLVSDLKEISDTARFPSLRHPTALVGSRISIGEGALLCAGNLLTTDLQVGDFAILNLDCTVGHDSVIGDFVTLAPSVNVSGSVNVGTGCDLGTSSSVIQGITVGAWSVVGAGAAVVHDLPPNVTAVGVPARVIKERQAGWHLR